MIIGFALFCSIVLIILVSILAFNEVMSAIAGKYFIGHIGIINVNNLNG
jgi:hypothetical protein